MPNYQLDEIDRRILSFLVNNARMPFLEIASECNISGAAVHQRFKRMKSMGIVTGSRMIIKPSSIGLNVCAFISVSLSEDNKYLEVVECHFITGKAALFLKAYCFDNEHLMNMLINTIQHIPYVQATNTMISLDQAFEREVWVKDFNAVSFKTGSLTE